jgi:hypothetical protein
MKSIVPHPVPTRSIIRASILLGQMARLIGALHTLASTLLGIPTQSSIVGVAQPQRPVGTYRRRSSVRSGGGYASSFRGRGK